jgi:hypothetical protein
MMIKPRLFALLVLALGALSSAAQPAAPDATETPFSTAEKMLWLGNQLQAIKQPMVLNYDFERTGTYEHGFTDTVELTITRIKPNGLKDGAIRFFTGERHFPVPPAENTDANPVLKVYFQGDVYEMNRLTDPDGKSRERWRYFQRRIKLALAEAASVKPVSFDFAGQQYDGQQITFQPYAKDPKRHEFEQFADKAYSVIVAERLPGYVYRVETVVPGARGEPPLVHEVLQLKSAVVTPREKTAAR